MNWGHGVIAAFALFVGYILYLVVGCVNQDIHLVSNDYYAQEVAYQSRIDEIKNAEPFAKQISIIQNNGKVNIQMPQGIANLIESGSIHFFRPSDETLDVIVSLEDIKGSEIAIEANQFQQGRYEVQIQWTINGQGYFVKKDLFI